MLITRHVGVSLTRGFVMIGRRARLPDEPFRDLESRVFASATVIPATRAPDGRFLMGAFDSHGQPVPESLLSRIRHGVERQKGFPGELNGARRHVDGTAIYAGVLDRHFGHFVLESLARLWPARLHPELPIVWSVESWRRGPVVRGYRSWQAEILGLLGISNRPVFVAQATTFDELLIPTPGYVMEEFFHPTHRDFLGVLDHAPVDGRKTWLSRANLSPGVSQSRSASLLDRRLADAGWTIVHPQELSVTEQVEAIATSERLAGEQGSAFHTVMFLRDVERLNVDIIGRGVDLPADIRNHDYETIATAKGFTLRIHRANFERVIERRSKATVHKIGQNTFKYLELLGEPSPRQSRIRKSLIGSTMTKPPPSRLSGRLLRLGKTNSSTSYLEIGVARGRTFLNVDFAVKHAVDPHFRFDVRQFETPGTEFFEMTSDDFFVYFAEPNQRYDLIFLDGLHTFEQTLRDLCSSLLHSNESTIWLINDAIPVDVFSSIKSQPKAHKYRRLYGQSNDADGKAWHGDVFKLIYAVHDFFPNLSYRVVATGNPQMVVIRRQRKDFSPRLNDLEQISRLTYFDLLDDQPRLNLASEDEVVTWLESSLATEAAGEAG